MSTKSQNLKNIGAICILGFENSGKFDETESTRKCLCESPDDPRKYKIIYTKNCMSQIHKHYESQSQKITVHLYKYCTKTDAQKIRESIKLFKINGEANKNCYLISLDELFDHFLKHFEPDLAM